METELPPYSDEFVQDLHLLPFSPKDSAPVLFIHFSFRILRWNGFVKVFFIVAVRLPAKRILIDVSPNLPIFFLIAG